MSHKENIRLSLWLCTLSSIIILFSLYTDDHVFAGGYTAGAHGNSTNGVNRTSLTGYSVGNCAHCHEQHGQIDGSEPSPTSGSPSFFALFSDNFDSSVQSGPYAQADNFCFQCHISTGGIQSGGGVTNKQYAIEFGGYDTDSATDIMGAFNLKTYHNLYNVQVFAESKFSFFKADSNPCVACHNPHLAKDHNNDPQDPTLSTISRPSDHGEVWGDDASERMDQYTYRAPYYYNSGGTTHEPGGVAVDDGSKTIDYVSFCLDCHQFEVPISTPGVVSFNLDTTPGYLTAIDWSNGGDMHGERARIQNIDGSPKNFGSVIAPYNEAPVQSNYVLSCLDCHEPHGSVLNLVSGYGTNFLLRKEVNGNKVEGCGALTEQAWCHDDFCLSCHTWSHCGGPLGCFGCHHHGAENKVCGAWTGPNF